MLSLYAHNVTTATTSRAQRLLVWLTILVSNLGHYIRQLPLNVRSSCSRHRSGGHSPLRRFGPLRIFRVDILPTRPGRHGFIVFLAEQLLLVL